MPAVASAIPRQPAAGLARLRGIAFVILAFGLGVLLEGAGLSATVADYWEDIAYLTPQHVMLTLISGGLAILVGIPLGIVLSRPRARRFAEGVMQFLNVGTTIPTLAVLALSMAFLGIGTVPAIFGLWVASLLPIVRNTYTGLLEVPAHLREAGAGMGMTPMQLLVRTEIPNALFVIFAGVRTALAINVGTVPLAFLIGGGGLGELIFTGIDLNEPGMMLAGAVTTALLAVIVDFLLAQAAYWLIPRGVNPLR